MIIPAINRQCVVKLKPGKGDGDRGFKSDHLINGSQRLFVILSHWRIERGAKGPPKIE